MGKCVYFRLLNSVSSNPYGTENPCGGLKSDVKLPQSPTRSAVEIGKDRADRVDIELLALDD